MKKVVKVVKMEAAAVEAAVKMEAAAVEAAVKMVKTELHRDEILSIAPCPHRKRVYYT